MIFFKQKKNKTNVAISFNKNTADVQMSNHY